MDSHLKIIYKIAKVLQYIAIVLYVLSSFILIYGFALSQMMIGIIGTIIVMGVFTLIQIVILRGIKKQMIKYENNEELSYVIPVILFVFNIATLVLGVIYIYLIYLVYRYNSRLSANQEIY